MIPAGSGDSSQARFKFVRGLVFVEALQLSGVQWAALLIAMALYMSPLDFWSVAVMAQGGMLIAFWGRFVLLDVRLLFQAAEFLQPFPFRDFLSEFAFRNYVKLQPPFFTFWVSRAPDIRFFQIYAVAWVLLCVALLFALFGERARFLAASPVWLLMSTQPSNDLILFGLLLCVLRLHQIGHRCAGALLFGVAYPAKPLAVLLLPSMAIRLRGWLLLSLVIWAGYVQWSLTYYFGVRQWNFLLHQLCVK